MDVKVADKPPSPVVGAMTPRISPANWRLMHAAGSRPADGLDAQETLKSYPSLTRESIQAATNYAAELARERVIAVAA
ncbi:MAG TPA: DUF433 domain-containing protein [Anaerolineales bacterium]|nr:DUF433 domain-containing protein [Anaerolineales bacterium]